MQERLMNINALPLVLSRPAAEQILTALRLAILEIRLEPGDLISESEIARSFGASRTPVREAFSRLREEGLVITLPSRGTYVSKLSEPEIRGAQFIREVLELAVVTRLSEKGLSSEHRQCIEGILDAQKNALKKNDFAAFIAADETFHVALSRATGISRLEVQLDRERAVLNRVRRMLSQNDNAYISKLYAEHCVVYNAIIARDTDKATDEMRKHLQRVLTTLSGLRAQHQEYFE